MMNIKKPLIPIIDGYLCKTLPNWKSHCKLSLSMVDGNKTKRISIIKEKGLDNADLGSCYWSHSNGRRALKIGDVVLSFVQLENNRDLWLFVSSGIVEEVPLDEGPCKWRELDELSSLRGCLVMEFHKGNIPFRWCFVLDKNKEEQLSLHEIYPEELAKEVEFPGYENCKWNFETLLKILNGSKRYSSIRDRLKEIKGVYLLADSKEGKFYVGSAYGHNGIAQRWECYLDTSTGGNKGLIELYKKLGPDYFKNNFTFSLLDWFDSKVSDKHILERESHWKDVLMTRIFGYNKN